MVLDTPFSLNMTSLFTAGIRRELALAKKKVFFCNFWRFVKIDILLATPRGDQYRIFVAKPMARIELGFPQFYDFDVTVNHQANH